MVGWKSSGLHSFNPVRIKFILNSVGKSIIPKILDIGCGGESMRAAC